MLAKKSNSQSAVKFKLLPDCKRSQSQLITTILIILLVLAAVIIVWQVVNNTIESGAEQVEEQSNCLGLTIDITSINKTGTGNVTIRPNIAVQAFRVYVKGIQHGGDGGSLTAFEGGTAVGDTTQSIATGDKITTAGKINEVWCDGKNSKIA